MNSSFDKENVDVGEREGERQGDVVEVAEVAKVAEASEAEAEAEAA